VASDLEEERSPIEQLRSRFLTPENAHAGQGPLQSPSEALLQDCSILNIRLADMQKSSRRRVTRVTARRAWLIVKCV
jgi:hypothetical protein